MKSEATQSKESGHSSNALEKNKEQDSFFGHKESDKSFFQPKLKIGSANDKFESEADNVADKIISDKDRNAQGPALPVQRQRDEEKKVQEKRFAEIITPIGKGRIDGGNVQRKPAFESSSEYEQNIEQSLIIQRTESDSSKDTSSGSDLSNRIDNSRNSGAPLPTQTRHEMEDGIGADFGNVRVHTDQEAVQMNRDLNSRAFTSGNDIYFNEGQYNPGSKEGDHLLAHELTHTVQQGRSGSIQPKIQLKRVADPQKVVIEVFENEPGIGILKIPQRYWFSLSNRVWLDQFIRFLDEVDIDNSQLSDKQLVTMALLYFSLPKKFDGWSDGEFIMSTRDKVNNYLEIAFKLPTIGTNEIGISILFNSPTDNIYFEISTTASSYLDKTLAAMSMAINSYEYASASEQFKHVMKEGAYKGYGAEFNLNYYLFTPNDPYKSQTIYYEEKIDFILPQSDETLTISFTGKFDVELYQTLNKSQYSELRDLFPSLLAAARNIESTIGGHHSKGMDAEVLVIAFANEKKAIHSLHQILPAHIPLGYKAEYFTRVAISFIEGYGFEETFIDKTKAPEHKSYNTLAEAQDDAYKVKATGYIIVEENGKYMLYQLTTADLIWLAKIRRGDPASTAPRYANIDISNIVDCDFFELPIIISYTVNKKLSILSLAYFATLDEVRDWITKYTVVYKTKTGFYGILDLNRDTAAKTWKSADDSNRISGKYTLTINGASFEMDIVLMIVSSDEKGKSFLLEIDDRHFEGREIFADMYMNIKDLDKVSDTPKVEEELKKLKKPEVQHFVLNELMRPDYLNTDKLLKQALKELQTPGSMLNEKLAAMAFGMVAGEVERNALEMMEKMLTLLDEMVSNDMYMKLMLMNVREGTAAEKLEKASVFTEDSAQALKLITIMENDETMHSFLMNKSPHSDLTLDTVAAQLLKSRDELKQSVDERKGLHEKKAIRYELLFIVQKGEMGDMLRKDAYDLYGFDLDPSKFPHDDHVITSLFPSPLHEGGKQYTNLLEQLYINKAVHIYRTFKTLKTVQMVAIVASVFSLARGAGIWAASRLGLIAGTAKALIVEALVTSVVAGVILEGIQVAMGKKFSWEDLFKGIGIAFIMMLTFGWVNSLFKLAITKFTVNALLFIGFGVGMFYLEHKRFPKGFEFNLIVLESILMITLLHIGTRLTDPLFRNITRQYHMHPELRPISRKFDSLTSKIAKEAASQKPNRAKMRDLGDQFMENMKAYKEWIERNKGLMTEAEAKSELAKIETLQSQWREAKFLDVTRLQQVGQTDTVFYYKPGAESAKALQEKYGKENVEIDPDTNVARVKTPDGEFIIIPESVAVDAAKSTAQGEKLSELFGNNIRMLDVGVFATYEKYLTTLEEYYIEQKGTWKKIGPEIYMGEINGAKLIFVLETSTNTLKTALALEGKAEGRGMEYFKQTLTSEGLEGLKLLRGAQMQGLSDKQVLEKLTEIANGIVKRKYPRDLKGEFPEPRPKTLLQYLEKLYFETKADVIRDYRVQEGLPAYVQNIKSTGTIAFVETSMGRRFGASDNLTKVREIKGAEIEKWAKRLVDSGNLGPKDSTTFLKHAEAEALIKAHNDGVKFSEEVILYSDRPTCTYACRIHLHSLLPLLGIKTLKIYWINAANNPSLIIKAKK